MSTDETEDPIPLREPREGLPPVVETDAALDATIAAFAAGSGPVALDAERASGYRYGHKAYLIQLRRSGAGTALIDPISHPDLTGLAAVISDAEWILHAANQDLPCLADVGLEPSALFDTELAARLLGLPRVGLGPLIHNLLGYHLEKGYSAVDWSTRPLPESWLTYAALDVELLIDLRDLLHDQLEQAGKLSWAQEEFAAIRHASPPRPRKEPWRRTSGMHRVRDRRGFGVVRELWQARDRCAQERDLSPGRVLSDAAIIQAALARPTSVKDLQGLPGFTAKERGHREASRWLEAIKVASELPEAELPAQAATYDGPPPARLWANRRPEAAARLAKARQAMHDLSEELNVPVENLLLPDTLRRAAWDPPETISAETLGTFFRERGARDWQIAITAAHMAKAFRDAATAES